MGATATMPGVRRPLVAWRNKLALCLAAAGMLAAPTADAHAWVRRGGARPAFGYALPADYSPPSFYPPNAAPPAEEAHYQRTAAALAARRAQARRIERFPTFPETPTELAHEISGSIAAMAEAHAAAEAQRREERQQRQRQRQQQVLASSSAASSEREEEEEEQEELGFPTSTPRLRVDLQLDDLADLSGEWARAVGHRYLPFYEKVLLTLRARGYKKVLAVFGFKQEAQFVEKRLSQAGALTGIRVDYLAGRESKLPIDVGRPDVVLFFNPQTINGDLSELSEFQRVTAVATIRGAPIVLVNPSLAAFSHLPRGLDVVRPMILSDFSPCFQASAHKYRFNPYLAYSIIRRGVPASAADEGQLQLQQQQPVLSEGPWEVFAHDARLPGSGWAFLESREEEPFRLEVESKYFDANFYIRRPASGLASGENPYRDDEAERDRTDMGIFRSD